MNQVIASVAFALLLIVPTQAQVDWEYTAGPPSGHVGAIVADSSGTLYTGAFKSTDDGRTWSVRPSAVGAVIAADRQDKLYSLRDGVTLWRSTDGGESWSLFYQAEATFSISKSAHTVAPDGDVFSLWYGYQWDTVDLRSYYLVYFTHYFAAEHRWERVLIDSTIYVGANIILAPNGELYTYGNSYINLNRISRSEDSGRSWQSADVPTDSSNRLYVESLAAAVDGTIYVKLQNLNTTSRSIIRSVDHGASWQTTPLTPEMLSGNPKIGFSASGDVLVAARNALYRSSDRGENWTVTVVAGLDPTSIVRTPNGHLFIGSNDRGIYRSEDDGATWKVTAQGMNDGTVSAIQVAPDGTVYALSNYSLYRTTDHGESWQLLNAPRQPRCMEITADGSLFFGTADGNLIFGTDEIDTTNYVYQTKDRGENWSRITIVEISDPGPRFLSLLHDDRGALYVGTRKGLFKSIDQGVTWRRLALQDRPVRALTRGAGGMLVAAMSGTDRPVYVSLDRGENWYPSQYLSKSWIPDALTVGGDQAIYVTSSNKLLRSTNLGYDWDMIPSLDDSVTSLSRF